MFNSSNQTKCQPIKESTTKSLHIDTDPLGISFYEKGAVSTQHKHHQLPSSLSPFPSPSSSSSSSPVEPKSFPRKADVCRNKCQINRPSQSMQSPTKVSAKSWENIKSPAASFLAGFAFSPVSNQTEEDIEEEQEGDEIDDYVLDKIIGYGGFATVRKGFRVSDGQKVAIKIIKKSQHQDVDFRLERELSIWRRLEHPNIVCLQKVLETDNAFFLICDYCAGGNLLDKLKQPMNESEARDIFVQLSRAVEYLHQEAKVCHKDLKLENVLFDQENRLKLCDFGLAICQQPIKMNPATQLPLSPEIVNELECAAGSLAYAAPEQIKSKKAISCPSTDIWSLGVILYTLVTAKLPFADDFDLRLQQKIMEGQYEMPNGISSSLQDLIRNCLSLKPETRFNICQVLQSSWCTM
jgi:tRNA A-37 threonylcarbamoyl transferase component Bud32